MGRADEVDLGISPQGRVAEAAFFAALRGSQQEDEDMPKIIVSWQIVPTVLGELLNTSDGGKNEKKAA